MPTPDEMPVSKIKRMVPFRPAKRDVPPLDLREASERQPNKELKIQLPHPAKEILTHLTLPNLTNPTQHNSRLGSYNLPLNKGWWTLRHEYLHQDGHFLKESCCQESWAGV